MTNLIELGDTLTNLQLEMVALGMPYATIARIDAVHSVIPNIERARELRK